jgi:uncharacterized protein with HEPN domain
MHSEQSHIRLIQIRDNIRMAQHFVGAMSYAEFLADIRTVYAVVRCLEIISEASRRVPHNVNERHPELPWTDIAGSANIYRHDYEKVREALIWKTVKDALPVLLAAVEQELLRRDHDEEE